MTNCNHSILLRSDVVYEAKVNLSSGDITLDVDRFEAAGFTFETLPDIRIVGYRTADQHGNVAFELYYRMESHGNLEHCIGIALENETKSLEDLFDESIPYVCSEIDWEKMASIL